MNSFVRELRRREVFRTAGLYVGVAWIVIEVASVVLPAFDTPAWIMRWLVVVALVGFPVAIVLAWFLDVTDQGIVIQTDTDNVEAPPFGGRRTDFVVIGILSIALAISVYLNFSKDGPAEPAVENVTVLVAGFANATGDPVFDRSLEQALAMGLEGASFINAVLWRRVADDDTDPSVQSPPTVSEAVGLAGRHNAKVVLTGSITSNGAAQQLELQAIDVASGNVTAEFDAKAASSSSVLAAVYAMAADVRSELGDRGAPLDSLRDGSAIETGSLAAVSEYVLAQSRSQAGRHAEAVEHYREAVQHDPGFARAWAGWGLAATASGAVNAGEPWETFLSLPEEMPGRERLRMLGMYHSLVSLDYSQAAANLRQLVTEFPADAEGHRMLAQVYAETAQHDKAFLHSQVLLNSNPDRFSFRAEHARYAMLARDWETATATAAQLIAEDPRYLDAYLILATAALHRGDSDLAREHYLSAQESGAPGASLAAIGLADIHLYDSEFDAALALLEAGTQADLARDDAVAAALKTIVKAQARQGQNDLAAAVRSLRDLPLLAAAGQQVPGAEIFVAAGLPDEAAEIGEYFRSQPGARAAAYAGLIDGLLAAGEGRHAGAIRSYTAALRYSDLWLLRYYLGQAYLAAGYPAEASAEFSACVDRRGEAGRLFSDLMPTWRYTAGLDSWLAAANRELGGPAAGN